MYAAREKYRNVDMETYRPLLSPSPGVVSCSICLEPVEMKGERSIARLKCAHLFHLDCIGSAFNAKGAMQCPNCRQIEGGQWLYAGGCLLQSQLVRNALSDFDGNSGTRPTVVDGRFGQTTQQASHRPLQLSHGENSYSTNMSLGIYDRHHQRMPWLASEEQVILVNLEPITPQEPRPWVFTSNETARSLASDMDGPYSTQSVLSRTQFRNIGSDNSAMPERSTYRTMNEDLFPINRHSMNRGIGDTRGAPNQSEMHFVPEPQLQDHLMQHPPRGVRYPESQYLVPDNVHGTRSLQAYAVNVSERGYYHDQLDHRYAHVSGQDYNNNLSDGRFDAGYARYAPHTTSWSRPHGSYNMIGTTGAPWL